MDAYQKAEKIVARAKKVIGIKRTVEAIEEAHVLDLPVEDQPEAMRVALMDEMVRQVLHRNFRPAGMHKVKGWDWRAHPGLIVTADAYAKERGISKTGLIEMALLSYMFSEL